MVKDKYAIWFGYNSQNLPVYFNGFNADGTYNKETINEKNGEIPSFTCSKAVANRIKNMINNGFTRWLNTASIRIAKDYSYLYVLHRIK